MTGRKNRPLQVPHVVPYKALEKFPKALYGTTEGTCSGRFLRPVMKSQECKLKNTLTVPSDVSAYRYVCCDNKR